MNAKNPKVDGYIRKNKPRSAELERLRTILLGCGLSETIKWRTPCYMHGDRNIALLGAAKGGCTVSFFKGALLKDPRGVLIQVTKNMQAMRHIAFADARQIAKLEPVLRAYIREAVEAEEAGLKVRLKTTAEFEVPEEFADKLDKDAALKTAFDALTPGRQRGYLLHFAGAKRSETRASRVDKCRPQILAGKGLDDDYMAKKKTKKKPGK